MEIISTTDRTCTFETFFISQNHHYYTRKCNSIHIQNAQCFQKTQNKLSRRISLYQRKFPFFFCSKPYNIHNTHSSAPSYENFRIGYNNEYVQSVASEHISVKSENIIGLKATICKLYELV